MARRELGEHLEHFDYRKYTDTVRKWLALPSIYQLEEEDWSRAVVLLNPQGSIGGLLRWENRRVHECVRKEQYQEAFDLVRDTMKKGKGGYQGNELAAGLVKGLALRGFIKEYLATHGPYKDSKFQRELLLSATDEYMAADLVLGIVTPYAQRVGNCWAFLNPKLFSLAAENLYGPRNYAFIGAEGRELVDQMRQGARARRVIGRVPFGGKIELLRNIPANLFPLQEAV